MFCVHRSLGGFSTIKGRIFHKFSRALSVSCFRLIDYETERKQFQFNIPEKYNFAKVVEQWAAKEKSGERSQSAPALWWLNDAGQELKWNYQELVQDSKRVANVLSGVCELQRTDHVMVVLPRVPEWWLMNLACCRTGTVIIPGTSLLRKKDLLYRLQASQAQCVVADLEIAALIDEIADQAPSLRTKILVGQKDQERKGWLSFEKHFYRASAEHECVETSRDDPSLIFFTSGTVGPPKMVLHTCGSFAPASYSSTRYWLDLTEEDVFWNISDTGWAKALVSSLYAPMLGGSCMFVYHSQKFEAKPIIDILQRYPVSVLCMPPTAYRMMIQQDVSSGQFKSLRRCVSAGEPLNPEVIAQWEQMTGFTIREGYGQSETNMVAAMACSMPVRPGSMGKSLPGFDMRVVDENGEEVERGKEGSFAVKIKPSPRPPIFTEYLNEPEKNKNCVIGDYYLTGDRAICDSDGYLWFVGRDDDIINSAGYRIGPFEVESAILEHPAVVESAVVSSPDELRGEVVKAFVVLVDDFTGDREALIQEIKYHVKDTTAPYKYPRKIEFVDSLPKTVSGKIKRVELRQREWQNNNLTEQPT